MANKVREMLYDISFRLGDHLMRKSNIDPRAVIIREMRRLYKRLNTEAKAIEKQWDIDFSNPGTGVDYSVSDGYIALPSDFIQPYKIDPYCWFRHPEVFDNQEQYTFTIHLLRIYFSNVTEDTTY